MGIDITKEKVVSISEEHEQYVVTSLHKNPVQYHIGTENLLTAIFQRRKSKRRTGDGNPLIYALKEINGFSISNADKDVLYMRMLDIISKHFSSTVFDAVVVLPSSKPVAQWTADACCQALNLTQIDRVFIKASNDVVLTQIKPFQTDKQLIALRKRLETRKPDGIFSLKELSQHQRSFVNPVLLNPGVGLSVSRLLLVDDLVSSGTTLQSGCRLLKAQYPDIDIECLSLLGPLT